ncbi:hypothetical protein O181_073932 [Austropuccinia psidii MF-1]|uniref:Reverse transcriptase Ty1/copia-type domain-containing protein n=1 Tax=Austropuccinia psidii MF-1 TaxID=1389203 RepID=A0A9Q3FA07_9BASI|nr:hypothetical protein [Austropuccinia psidii MF-1]
MKSAFLNALLAKTVYLSIPQGLDLDQHKTCLHLNKAIYGLKQAPLDWYKRLKNWLTKVGFTACLLDPCVFYRNKPPPIWLYVHVNDIAIFGSNVKLFKDEISTEFEIKDMGMADLILGIKVTHGDGFISLDQQHFIESLLRLYITDKCKPVSTPLPPQAPMGPASADELARFKQLKVSYCSVGTTFGVG